MPKRHFPDSCSHSVSNQPAHTKTVDKKCRNKRSVTSRSLTKTKLMGFFFMTNHNILMLQKTNPER